MSIADFFHETIQGVFYRSDVVTAPVSATSLLQRVTSEPLLVLILLTIGLSICAFLMALCAFFRRSSNEAGPERIDQRLQVIESLLRDQAVTAAFLRKKFAGETEFLRQELIDIRASLEHLDRPSFPRKRISNG